jgi:hypothetical protein
MTLAIEVKLGGENPTILRTLREPVVDPQKYPVFARAYEFASPAHDVQIEWMTPQGVAKNYQQIFRRPFAYRIDGSDFGEKAEAALEGLLADMELACTLGVPTRTSTWPTFSWLGGVKHYLGRELEPNDKVSLRPLRAPVLLLQRGAEDLFNDYSHEGEWLCETSLMVVPAKEN